MTAARKRKQPEEPKACLFPSGDLLREVFAHLPALDLCVARGVCREWRDAASDESLWKEHCDVCWFEPVPDYPGNICRAHAGGVPYHAQDLYLYKMYRLAYAEAFSERERAWITTEELCRRRRLALVGNPVLPRKWWFRFKEDAGEEWQAWDGWWSAGGHGRPSIFDRFGTVTSGGWVDNKDDEEPMEHNWGYARDIYEIDTELTREGWKHYLLDPDDTNRDENKVSEFKEMGYFANLGDYAHLPFMGKERQTKSPHKPKKYAKELRAAGRNGTKYHVGCALVLCPPKDEPAEPDEWVSPDCYPQCVVRRHPETWGWILESCWTLQTSWPMPTREEEELREDLADDFLKYDATEQKLEVKNYNRDIPPDQDEWVDDDRVEYTQEDVVVEVTDVDGTVQLVMPSILALRVCAKPHNRGSMKILTGVPSNQAETRKVPL